MPPQIAGPAFWLIVERERTANKVLTVRLDGKGEALPVFSFEEEARTFLQSEALGSDWEIRETGAGELVSILLGPCANICKVMLDPTNEGDAETLADLVSLGSKTFIEHLLGREERPDSEKEP